MKFQLSIRGAIYLTTAIAFYASILALGYRGNLWGKGITFAVTCSLVVWLLSAAMYWTLIGVHRVFGAKERQMVQPKMPSEIESLILSNDTSTEFVSETGSEGQA